LPHWSGINTLLKLTYLEGVRKVGEYEVAFVGWPAEPEMVLPRDVQASVV
jgi:hypothetical protein